MNAERPEPEAEPPEQSVLGSLPRQRPGRRSPRRAASSAGESTGAPSREEQADPTAESKGGVEDLAWAGIAVAAEAATLGVRIANRVLEAGTGWRKRGR